MLRTPIFEGQGLGNQLHNYVTVRSLAKDKGFTFGIIYPDRFKGHSFMNLDMGIPTTDCTFNTDGTEPDSMRMGNKYYREADIDGGDYDPEMFNVTDNTIIHGNLQGENYFKHNKKDIREWLKVEPLEMPDDLCIINFRGGEYKYVPEFHLTNDYWDLAIKTMKDKYPKIRFEVHTDDREEASKFFPSYPIITDIGLNWRSIRYAKHLIISNSSFAWLPAWLGESKEILAPKFWGRRNKGYWFLKQNVTEGFIYL